MSQNLEFLRKVLVENLSPIERIAVLQDMGIINGVLEIHPGELKDAYQILQSNIAIDENSGDFECQFFDSLSDSIKYINATYGPQLINEKLIKREGESEAEFEKRKKESEQKQAGKEKEFVKQHAGVKKAEQAPLAKSLRSKGISQQDLADRLGVSKTTVSRWKTGIRNPNFENLEDLATMFGSVDSIFPELG